MKIKLSYWSANILIVIFLLSIWFLSSFGAGILFTEYLDKFQVGGFKVGFWFSQQGSIITFVLIIILYCFLMNRLDKIYNSEEE